MYKEELVERIYKSHKQFVSYLKTLQIEEYTYRAEPNAWASYEDVNHLMKVLKKINLALKVPKFLLKFLYGKSMCPSLPFEEIRSIYEFKIKEGAGSPKEFYPSKSINPDVEEDCNRLMMEVEKLLYSLNHFKERDLDMIILPHPLLGPSSLREFLYFCKIHVDIHYNACIQKVRHKKITLQ